MKLHHLGLAAAPLGLAALAWWGAPDPVPVPTTQPPAQAFPWATTAQVVATAETDTPAAPQATAGASSTAAGPALFDLCGLGRVTAPAAAEAVGGLQALPAPVGSEPLALARERMLAGLRSGSPAAQVAALLLQRPESEDPATRQAWAQQMVQTALASQHSAALVWAEEACGYLPDGAACRLGLVRARLRLEPDNGLHWAALADEDPGAAEEAWRGLQQARRWTAQPQTLLVTAQSALPADVPAYLRQALGAELQLRVAALPQPGEGFLQERCSSADGAARGVCDGVTRLLLEHSDGTQPLALGAQLAKRLGWPTARVQAVQAELQALASPAAQWMPDAEQPLSCASVQGWQRQMAALAQGGELAALRGQLAAQAGGQRP
jgi:hypothetical protein